MSMRTLILYPTVAMIVVGLLGGCANLRDTVEKDPLATAKTSMTGPAMRPAANRTDLEAALRCMDRLYVTYGVRDIPVILEELPDKTGKMNAGAREMLMSAMSKQTQRSRAIQLIPVQASVVHADRRDFIKAAAYAIQGSISQLDDSLVRRVRDNAVCVGPICVGTAESASYTAMGLDLGLIRTSNLTMVAGATSNNAVLVARTGVGADGEVNLKKFGTNFNFTFSSSEGQGQALRALIELGSIELFGRLMRVPYWSCLGAGNGNHEVSAEIDDWWESMAGDIKELVAWLQRQMLVRKLYKGPVDGMSTNALLRAVQAYQIAMGLPRDADLDSDFFKAYLAADHSKLEEAARTALSELPEPSVVEAPPKEQPQPTSTHAHATAGKRPAPMLVQDRRGARASYRKGEYFEIEVLPPRDGALYCYFISPQRGAEQFFPNQLRRSPLVRGGEMKKFPDKFPFRLVANRAGERETVLCATLAKEARIEQYGNKLAAARDSGALTRLLEPEGLINLGSIEVIVD